jgi:citrate lyase subunit beta/citryl-CoA lyase
MLLPDLRLCRSILFLPASNPRAVEKAHDLGADMVVLDCEDAVKPDDKEGARASAVEVSRTGFAGRLTAIRMNGRGTPWHEEDIAAFRESNADVLIIPKAEKAEHVRAAAQQAGKPLLAMIETASGVLNAAAIAHETAGLLAGTNDLSADLGLPLAVGRAGLAHSLQMVILAARAAGIAAFDGVYNKLDDADGLARQCEEGKAFGFDGKSLIHPSQIDVANRIFGPADEEIEAAERLIAAATGGAQRFEGRMIETLHVEQARAVLAKARH